MSETTSAAPRVFISYSWSSPPHEQRVLDLAERLAGDGIHVVIDKYDLKEGQDLNSFMEQMVKDPEIKKVLIICDKVYAEKADSRKGGVGTESQIISFEVYRKVDQHKFVGVVFEANNGEAYLPVFLKGRFYIDMSSPEREAENYERLVRAVYEKPLYRRPTIGKPPDYLLENEQSVLMTRGQFRLVKDAVLQSRPYIKSRMHDYLERLLLALEDLRPQELSIANAEEKILSSIGGFLRYRNEYIEFLDLLCTQTDVVANWDVLVDFF
jgi:SEFIR domain